jgi:hypothetical protein
MRFKNIDEKRIAERALMLSAILFYCFSVCPVFLVCPDFPSLLRLFFLRRMKPEKA